VIEITAILTNEGGPNWGNSLDLSVGLASFKAGGSDDGQDVLEC